jgi:hypothetical protein
MTIFSVIVDIVAIAIMLTAYWAFELRGGCDKMFGHV